MNTAKEKISSLQLTLLSISTKYVTRMNETGESRKSRPGIGTTALYILYLSVLCVRIVINALIYNWPDLFSDAYFTYDLWSGFLGPSRMNLMDGNLCLVLWPATVIIIFLHCTVTFYRRLQLTSFAFQLIVSNRECFWQLNPHLNLKTLMKIVWKNDPRQLSLIKLFSRRKLSHFPHLPHSARCQAVLLSQVLDILIACFVAQFALFCLFGVFYYFAFLLWPFYSLLESLVIIFDVSMIFYAVWHSTNIFLYLVHVFHVVLFVLVAQQRAMNARLKRRISLLTKTSKKSSSKLAALLNQYNSCHFHFIRSLLITNREYISTFLWLFFWTMFPLNTYSLATVTLRSVPLSVKMLLLVNSSLQIGNATLAIFPMLKTVSPVNSASRYFHWAQPHLNVSQINLKIKLLTYYDVLTIGEKIAYTVGVFGHVTPKALFEVLVKKFA